MEGGEGGGSTLNTLRIFRISTLERCLFFILHISINICKTVTFGHKLDFRGGSRKFSSGVERTAIHMVEFHLSNRSTCMPNALLDL